MAAAQRNSKAGERFEDTAAALPLKGKIRTLVAEAGGFKQGEEQHPCCPASWVACVPEVMLGQTGVSVVLELVKIHPKWS